MRSVSAPTENGRTVTPMYKYKINFSGVAYVAAETEEDALENFFDGYVLSDTVEVQSTEVVEEY